MGIGVSDTGVPTPVGTAGRLAPPEKRLSAIASVGMAAGIVGFVSLPVMHLLIELARRRLSNFRLTATTALLIPLARLIGGKPPVQPVAIEAETFREALAEPFRHPGYLVLTTGFLGCGFHIAFVLVHLPAFSIDRGLPTRVGPFARSVAGIAGKLGRCIEKRQGRPLLCFGRGVLFLGFLYLLTTPVTAIVICGLLGLLWLVTIPLTSGLLATLPATTWMSMRLRSVFLSHRIGVFLGVWLSGMSTPNRSSDGGRRAFPSRVNA
jgi:hypothetical protein